MTALKVRNLKKIYPAFTLKNLSFDVEEGRIAGLIGRNGAGKSTVIKSILNLISSEGQIEVFGKDARVNEDQVKQLIGFAGGGFRFYPLKKLSVIRKSYESFYSQWSQYDYEHYIKAFGLDESKKVKELSEGMKVKFALALALSHGARLLIMDEPTSGLDPISREEFGDIVLSLVKNNKISVLFSTHVTSDLMRIADDIIYISKGESIACSSLSDLLAKYRLAHFSSFEEAQKTDAVGVKAVKDGYEGLLPSNCKTDAGVRVCEATIDHIMIHLEADKNGGDIC